MSYNPAEGDQSAFPSTRDTQTWGLTKREYFAALMMQALIARFIGELGIPDADEKLAETAVVLADALIDEL